MIEKITAAIVIDEPPILSEFAELWGIPDGR
jgi:hypothetical protein